MTCRQRRVLAAAAALALLALASGCGGTFQESSVGGVASYERGKQEFDREDWTDAIADLKAYVEQFPGTEKTDDALFYLGESYFKIKDYALASGQYDRLTRDFPTSSHHPDALFKLARCDDLQSRPAPLDQTETMRALSRYKDFLDLYPEHPLAPEARKRIGALNERLAEKGFRNGRVYARLKQWDAAAHYLGRTITEYPESRWTCESRLLLADVLVHMGRSGEAADTLRHVESCPQNLKRRAQDRLREIERRKD